MKSRSSLIKIGTLFLSIFAVSASPTIVCAQNGANYGATARQAIARNAPKLDFYLADKGVKLGSPVFLRVFKDKSSLELWMRAKNGKYKYIRQYRICGAQTPLIPTGIYLLNSKGLGQIGNNVLSITTNFPNQFQAAQKQKGQIRIIPRCAPSPDIGITDPEMDELFTIIYKSFAAGNNNLNLHVFPFALNRFNMFTSSSKPNYATLKQLAPIYQSFEDNHIIPPIQISTSGYSIIRKK